MHGGLPLFKVCVQNDTNSDALVIVKCLESLLIGCIPYVFSKYTRVGAEEATDFEELTCFPR